MKKKILLLFLLLPLSFCLRAQLIHTSFPTVYTYPGTTVTMPVLVDNFNGVASISLVFTYSNIALTYQNYQNVNPVIGTGMLINKMAVGDTDRVVVSWFNLTPVNLGSDTLLEFAFTYNGGATSLIWDTVVYGNCQYSNLDEEVLSATFENGSVSMVQPNSTILPVMAAVPGSEIHVPVMVANFNDAAHVDLKMDYDTSVLDYLGYQSVHPLLATGSLSISQNLGSIVTTWDSLTALLNIGDDTLYVLRFTYLGGTTDLSWDTLSSGACQYLGGTSNLLPSNFYDGEISSSVIQLQLASVSSCNGTAISVPVSVNNGNSVKSFSLTFTYLDSLVDYTGFQSLHPALTGGFSIQQSLNTLTMTWSDTAAINLGSAAICELNFNMQTSSGGYTELSWNNMTSEFLNPDGQNIPVNFIGGSISINPYINLGPDKEVCEYHTVELFAGGNFSSYLWSTGDTTATIMLDSTNGSGLYTVTVTDVNGCTGVDVIQVSFMPCVGIEEMSTDGPEIIVYPNPSSDGNFTILYQAAGDENKLEVVDLCGRIIWQRNIAQSNEKHNIQLNVLSEGVYFLRMMSEKEIVSKKLIVR